MSRKPEAVLTTLNKRESAALATFTGNVPESVTAAVAQLRECAGVLRTAADVQKNAQTVRGGLWSHVLAVVFAVEDASKGAPKVREEMYANVMGEFLSAKAGTPAATVKAYASTGKNVCLRLCGKVSRNKLEEASYKEIRSLLNPVDSEEAASLSESIRENLSYIVNNGFKGSKSNKDYQLNMEILRANADALRELRATLENEKESASHTAELARNLHELKTPAPSNSVVATDVDAKPAAAKRQRKAA